MVVQGHQGRFAKQTGLRQLHPVAVAASDPLESGEAPPPPPSMRPSFFHLLLDKYYLQPAARCSLFI